MKPGYGTRLCGATLAEITGGGPWTGAQQKGPIGGQAYEDFQGKEKEAVEPEDARFMPLGITLSRRAWERSPYPFSRYSSFEFIGWTGLVVPLSVSPNVALHVLAAAVWTV